MVRVMIAIFLKRNDPEQGLLTFLFDTGVYECTIQIGTNGGFATQFYSSRIGSNIIKNVR